MIRINQIKIPIVHTNEQSDLTKEQLLDKAAKLLKINTDQIKILQIQKKSIDARKKPKLYFVYSLNVLVENETAVMKKVNDKNIMLIKEKKYEVPQKGVLELKHRPVVAGAGPAGLFCAYLLAKNGYCPILIERGKPVEDRQADVEKFWKTGILDTNSNVQFGEGGAGAFSDGKLNTVVKDPVGRNLFVLETFVKFGAQEEILYDSKPHIGTDVLCGVIANMRKEILRLGGEICFNVCMTDLRITEGKLTAIEINHEKWIDTDVCVLALGHSARDTFQMLLEHGLTMLPKAFAVGFRVEHPQRKMNVTQYGESYADKLPAAPYKVTANLKNGRGVYSFCMCPGGYVVNASSEEGRLAVNGMSYAARDSKNANSAIIVSVAPEDFDGKDALAGVRFQQKLEQKTYQLAQGKIPQQLFGDYCANRTTEAYGSYESETKGEKAFANLRGLLPEEVENSFIEGMHTFSKAIPGFDRADVILSAIESRTSSPVRISRDEEFLSNIGGIYPCGEGAGYAGGITSAAMDGLKAAEAIIKKYAAKKEIGNIVTGG